VTPVPMIRSPFTRLPPHDRVVCGSCLIGFCLRVSVSVRYNLLRQHLLTWLIGLRAMCANRYHVGDWRAIIVLRRTCHPDCKSFRCI